LIDLIFRRVKEIKEKPMPRALAQELSQDAHAITTGKPRIFEDTLILC
jgi:hypothetical protein